MKAAEPTPSTPFTHEGVWCCERQCKCKWQGYALTHGLGWGTVPTILSSPAWVAMHHEHCGGELIQISEPAAVSNAERTTSHMRVLVNRLRCMASARDAEAESCRERGSLSAARNMEASSSAYQRAADELVRVLAGEAPPPPGEIWGPVSQTPDKENSTKS